MSEPVQKETGMEPPRLTPAAAGPPRGESVLDLLAEVCARFPDRPAVDDGSAPLTYAELDAAAHRLARWLAAAGVGEGSPVVVLLADRVSTIVALLAVFRAGGLFVPLPSDDPAGRLRGILALVEPAAALVDAPEAERLVRSARPEARIGVVPPRAAGFFEHAAEPLGLDVRFEGPRYIYFTSGSTGTPKGIVGHLKGVSHFIRWEIETLGIASGCRVSQLILPTFDAFLRDVLVPLCSGGTVCIPEAAAGGLDPRRLAAWIDRQGIELIHCVPSLFASLLAAEPAADSFRALCYVLMAGEVLPVAAVKRWMDLFGERVQLVNLYGSTETTMVKLFHPVRRSDLDLGFIPIGKPMAGTRAVLLDEHGNVCPRGGIGEIYLRSPYLTLGYFKDPELTARAFVSNPFSKDPNDRVYKTGDLARALADGSLQFLGRMDHLVKIRGVRVELGEIETALEKHPAVRRAVLVLRDDVPGEPRLVAYVVPAAAAPSAAELRAFLLKALPRAMVPTAFVALAQLPLTANGKLDRKALPPPPAGGETAGAAAFASPVEELLAGLWADILQLERVGPRDDFFALGGHSLLATQLLARLEEVLQVEIPLAVLFDSPTVEALAAAVEERLRQGLGPAAPPIVPALPVDRGARASLSFGQERLWFLDHWDPGNTAYNLPFLVRFEGVVDPRLLSRSLEEIVRRHGSLRTIFPESGPRIVHQLVLPPAPFHLPRVDLGGLPAARREEEAMRLARREAGRPFDLPRGPLLRSAWLRLGAENSLLVLSLHHIITDGWSLTVLFEELSALYAAFAAGAPSPLPELPVQYVDYSVWQRQWLQGEILERQLAEWRDRLAGVATLELPTDRPRPARQTFRGAVQTHRLPDALAEAVRRFDRRSGATPFMVLLASFAAVLSRYSGQTDVAVGTPVAGRVRREIEPLIGFFVNTLVLRNDLGRDPTFRELLARVRSTSLAAFAHQAIPFEKLVTELQPVRDASRSPLFQVLFAMQNVPRFRQQSAGLVFQVQQLVRPETKFDLSLALLDDDDHGLVAAFEHNTDLFDRTTVARLAAHFATLLAAAVAAPDRRLSSLFWLTAEERQQLLVEWNDTATVEPDGLSLFDRSRPGGVAVACAGRALSYEDLDRWSDRVARALLARLPAGGQEHVAVLMERSPELLACLLGVLKAGAVYLPLDPQHPAARQAQVLALSGAPLVLAAAEYLPVLASALGLLDEQLDGRRPEVLDVAAVLSLDTGDSVPRRALAPTSPPSPDNLVYTIFTSGSTGVPKGAMIAQRGLLNHLAAKIGELGLTAADRVAQTASQCFDISIWQLLAPLLVGGRIHIVPDEVAHDPARLLDLLVEEGIAILETVPSLLRPMLDEIVRRGSGPRLPALRWLIPTGEALPPDLCARWLAEVPGVPMVNAYGPTECSDDVTHQPVHQPPAAGSVRVPIGRPVRNTRLDVLDPVALCPQPVGVAGELFVGGDGVGRGYLRAPERTAQAFVPDPWSGVPGARLYRTGDRVRRLPDGRLDFLGRIDHQVKVRGFRIELGEIEAALAACSGVREAVVTLRGDLPGGPGLVAYVVPTDEVPVAPAALAAALRQTLPEYMVPAAWQTLPALPLTPNGKVDRKALPAPQRGEPTAADERARNLAEEMLAGLWAQALGMERVGVHDNFFELGGYSLLALDLVARLRQMTGVDLPLRSLFENPTVAGMAEVLANAREAAPPLPQIVPDPEHRGEPFPLTDLQQAYWMGGSGAFELGNRAYGFREVDLEGLDLPRYELAWRRLIARHDMLRAFIRPDGQFQILESVPDFVIEVQDLRGETPERREAVLRETRERMSRQGPPLDRWPLVEIRASLVDGRTIRLHLSMSLVICDAYSTSLLNVDLNELYRNPDGEMLPLDLSFRDYALALAGLEESDLYRRSWSYWQQRLPTLPPAPDLPLARSPRSLPVSRMVRRSGRLEPELWNRFRVRATRAGASPTAALAAVYAEVLAAWSKSRAFTLNLLYYNRLPLHPQVRDLIANFSSTNLLEVDLRAARTYEEAALGIQRQIWADLEHSIVSGVRVLRQWNQLHGAGPRAAMPVAFTSILHLRSRRVREARPRQVSSGLQTPQVWIDHQVGEAQGALTYNWDIVEELFPPGMVDDMFAAYERLLRRLAEEDDAWTSGEQRLTPPAQAALRAQVNATAAEVPAALLQDGLLEHARRTPEAPAVVAADRTLTYAELLRRSAALGGGLRERGARPGRLVAVVLEKGWEQAVGACAILLSGAAYLPLDPGLPRERLWYLLANGGVEQALTHSRWDRELEWPAGVERLCVDREEPGEAGELWPVQRPEDLAYVIYTSGSTGQPKGVMIDHRGACNTIADVNRRFAVRPADRTLGLSALSFDLSVYDVFGMLAAGGAVVVPEPSALREPARWLELVERERVTVWNSVPALLSMLVDFLEGQDGRLPASLRLVLLSGDWIPVTLPDRIRALAPGEIRVVSLGGATEASIWSILYDASTVDPAWPSIPYGRPMVNQRFHVLGESLEPCPDWVVGELYIGGTGLAQGYWGDEERTRERFIVHPRTGERLYRTGDLGRALPGGDIEFLGRDDFQVKVQGYRIELGEIEAALAQHPGVRAAVVAAPADRHGGRRLVGYVVAAAEPAPPADELRAFLAAKLPEYMVPPVLVFLAALPLSPNGKIDRQGLPAPDAQTEAAAPLAPRTDLEKLLVDVWEEALGQPVGVADDFFEIGGDSLIAVRIVSAVRSRLGRELPLAAIFSAPSVEALATLLAGEEVETCAISS
jgi:amino acid adenylation domain-containing protein